MNRINSETYSVRGLLSDQNFYFIPDYQREYVWTDREVNQLLQDIYQEFDDSDSAEYFIGTMVVCPGTGGKFEVIDGQQRLTTLYVFLNVFYRLLTQQNRQGEVQQILTPCFSSQNIDSAGKVTHDYRLELQYREAEGLIAAIVAQQDFPEDLRDSGKRIANAYKLMVKFLEDNFPDSDELLRFVAYVINKVKIIRIEAPDISDALKIFETINERGVGLNSMDLLKNLLFRQINREDFEELKNVWKEITLPLEKGGEKPLRFLRYFILANYKTDTEAGVREDEIYDWFTKNDKQCHYTSLPFVFAQKLVENAQAYKTFLAGQQIDGQTDISLSNIRWLMGSAGRQHLILFLAARHLEPTLFSHLAKQVETLLFTYIITRTLTKEYEKKFAQWSKKLLQIPREGSRELNDFINEHIRPEVEGKRKDFEREFLEVSLDSFQQYRIKYILAKITDYVEQQYLGNNADQLLDHYFDSSIQIEHILPATPTPALRASLGDEYDEYKQKLGNLTLLERPNNIVASNEFFALKKPLYKESSYHLTKSIVTRPDFGRNNSAMRMYDRLPQFKEWGFEHIRARQTVLLQLALDAWKVMDIG